MIVENDGLDLNCLDFGGSGPPLVLVHGGSAHAHWWDFAAPALAERFRVVALDLRGHGDSAWSPDARYTIADYARDLGRVVDALALGRPILVGHSLGAYVILRLAFDRPGRVRGVVLVDGRAHLGAAGARRMHLLRMLPAARFRTLEEAVERFRPLPVETSADPHVLEHVARWSFQKDPSGLWATKFDRASLSANGPFDDRPRLPSLGCPLLVVRGAESTVLSAKAAAEIVTLAPNASSVEIRGAFHHVLIDRPAELAGEIDRWLQRAI